MESSKLINDLLCLRCHIAKIQSPLGLLVRCKLIMD